MRIALLFLTSLIVVSSSYGQQSVTEDTLNWRLYYPLEVGNAWEWETKSTVGDYYLERRDIVGDTLIDERRYFAQVTRTIDVYCCGREEDIDTTLLRYDSTSSRLVEFVSEAQEERAYECDLSADFSGRAYCGAEEMNVEGRYVQEKGESHLRVGEDTVRFEAEKRFYNSGASISYYHGVGRLPSIGDRVGPGYIEYVYLKLDGKEYGQSVIATSIKEPARPVQTKSEITVFPNPVHSKLTIESKDFQRETNVAVFDLLGRKVIESVSCSWPQCSLDTKDLPGGTYIIRVAPANANAISKTFTVVR